MKVNVECSRCHNSVDGLIGDGYTGGFYDVNESSQWSKFANKNEEVVCDACMHNDFRYRSVYNGEILITVDKFFEEMIDWGQIEFSKEDKFWRVEVTDIADAFYRVVANGKGTTKEHAINDAYLYYLRNHD